MRIVYLEAGTDVLVRRYESSRRRHPLAADDLTLADTIEAERELLDPVKAEADVVVDTSDLNVHQLRTRMLDLFGTETPGSGMQTTIVSFGYKHGLPLDTDLVIDCRFLPNPHWVEELRPQTGLDEPVKDYVLGQDLTAEFLAEMRSLLELLLPAYVTEGKSYLTIAFGCTGGRHRSVAIAEEIAARLRDDGIRAAGDPPRPRSLNADRRAAVVRRVADRRARTDRLARQPHSRGGAVGGRPSPQSSPMGETGSTPGRSDRMGPLLWRAPWRHVQ